MLITKGYPHPVLNNATNDYKSSYFDIEMIERVERDFLHLSLKVELDEQKLLQLLNENKICFVVKVSCSSSKLLEIHEFQTFENNIKIDISDIKNKVEISSFIIAKENLNNFVSRNFSDDYEGIKFKIYKGDILAEGSEYVLDLEKSIDPLVKLPSIFQIILKEGKNIPAIDVNYSGPKKIEILLNKETFNNYKKLRPFQSQYNNLEALLATSIIIPALTDILRDVLNELDSFGTTEEVQYYIDSKEYSHYWFKVINLKLNKLGIDLLNRESITDSPLVLAQKLLGNPLSKGLRFFDEIFQNVEGENSL